MLIVRWQVRFIELDLDASGTISWNEFLEA